MAYLCLLQKAAPTADLIVAGKQKVKTRKVGRQPLLGRQINVEAVQA